MRVALRVDRDWNLLFCACESLGPGFSSDITVSLSIEELLSHILSGVEVLLIYLSLFMLQCLCFGGVLYLIKEIILERILLNFNFI